MFTGNKFTIFNNDDYLDCCTKMTNKVVSDGDGCIWILSSKGIGYFDPESDEFTKVLTDFDGRVWDMVSDNSGTIWLAVGSSMLSYDKSEQSLSTVITKTENINDLCINGSTLLFTDSQGGLFSYSIKSGRIETVSLPELYPDGKTVGYHGLAFIDSSHLLTSKTNGIIIELNLEDKSEKVLVDFSNEEIVPDVLTLLVRDNEYWIGTQLGALIYDSKTGNIEKQIFGEGGDWSLVGQYVRDFFNDNAGNVWASTLTGLKGWINYKSCFTRYVHDGTANSPIGISISAMTEGPDGRIWFGSDEGKVFSFSPESKEFKDYTDKIGIPEFSAIDDMEFKDSLLCVVSFGYGLSFYDTYKDRLSGRIHNANFKDIIAIPGEGVRVFVGSTQGLYFINGVNSEPFLLEGITKNIVTDISEVIDDRCWIGTYGNGFGAIDLKARTFTCYNTKNYPDIVKTDYISAIRLCEDGSLWIATDGEGVGRVSLDGGKVRNIRYYGVDEGLPYNSIRTLCFSGNDIWASTPNGLCQISRHNMKPTGVYLQADDVIGCHFNARSGFRASDGMMYFGTEKGIVAFDPNKMTDIFSGQRLIINNVTAGGLDIRQTMSENGKSVIASEVIRIKQKDAPIVSFSFSTMLYGNPNLISYICTLKSRHFSNVTTTTENPVSYLGLRPGKYDFIVETSYGPDKQLSDSKRVIILAPWYRSIVAYVVYLILAVIAFFHITRVYLRYKNRKIVRDAEINEEQRQKKVMQEKIDFMTNITHEIRTPISVISILVEKMFGKGKELSPDASALKMNVGRIVELCNDLLDLRKIQDGNMPINMHQENLSEILVAMCTPYETVTAEKNINMSISIPDDAVWIDCDKDSMNIILSNLLSNALKYCSSKILVNLSKIGGKAKIRVSSDGKIIPESDQERIFDAFYQSKAIDSHGTGIGLTFSRALAQKNGGSLYLDSNFGSMNSFVAEFPLSTGAASAPESISETAEKASDNEITDQAIEKSTEEVSFLVVEDNEYLRDLIATELSKTYRVLTASNGKEAVGLLENNNVELVISDIMMPEMDGCELCNLIKSSVEYSHISVILLTAAVGIDSQMRSLKSGADCYLEKPFNMDVLMTAVENIQINRKIRSKQFTASPLAKVECIVTGNTEQDLMDRLHNIVIEHIGDTEMTTTELAELMKLPRKVLIQKLKVNTGLSINEYVRICRLKKAAELLSENKYMIKEVAYYVGYTSSSYFAKHFTAQFGVSPSEFQQQYSGQNTENN